VKKNLAILGSTGSIGTQTLDVVNQHPDKFNVSLLTAYNNVDLLLEQAVQFVPDYVVIGNVQKANYLKEALNGYPTKVHAGCDAINDIVALPDIHIVLTALVGYAGLYPTLNAIKNGKDIALANKETLVVAGDLITHAARENNVKLLPVDSEHSAIFQCLVGENYNAIEKIYLTASGGPFRGKSASELKHITKTQALAHPNWCMGNKITIDSASLMNKGLEAIEAKWLFNLEADQIEVVVHPQSIIHSMVQFTDGSIKAQMGLPDMKLPIQFALGYPHRMNSNFERLNFTDYPSLTFEKPDTKTFRNLQLAYDAMHKGGNAPCILNAANEVAVEAFLNDKIGFLSMPDIIENALQTVHHIPQPNIDDYAASDAETRKFVKQLI